MPRGDIKVQNTKYEHVKDPISNIFHLPSSILPYLLMHQPASQNDAGILNSSIHIITFIASILVPNIIYICIHGSKSTKEENGDN